MMSAGSESDKPYIEKYIDDFTYRKTGEHVFLKLSTASSIKIVPKVKKGSLALGIFWVKILQHPRNFPVKKYHYKKHIGPNTVYEILLELDDVCLIVNLKTGLLEIKGELVVEWFTKYFIQIIDTFDGLISESPKPQKLFSEEDIQLLEQAKENIKKQYADNWPDAALQDGVSVINVDAGTTDYITEENIPQAPAIMLENELSEETSKLNIGKIINGEKIHVLWRSLLHAWCSSGKSQLYLVAPRIDVPTLVELCRICLSHREVVTIGGICIPMIFDEFSLSELKQTALKEFSPQEQIFIEYKIYTQFLYPSPNFDTKLIASVNDDGIVDILFTSANFNEIGFSADNKNLVTFNSIREDDFKNKYLTPVMGY